MFSDGHWLWAMGMSFVVSFMLFSFEEGGGTLGYFKSHLEVTLGSFGDHLRVIGIYGII